MKPRIVRNKLLRAKVFERDKGICCKCGRFDPRWIHDHELPLWLDGPDTLENSQTLCRQCERPKTSGETTTRAKTDRLKERHDLTKIRRGVLR